MDMSWFGGYGVVPCLHDLPFWRGFSALPIAFFDLGLCFVLFSARFPFCLVLVWEWGFPPASQKEMSSCYCLINAK